MAFTCVPLKVKWQRIYHIKSSAPVKSTLHTTLNLDVSYCDQTNHWTPVSKRFALNVGQVEVEIEGMECSALHMKATNVINV